MDGRTRAENDYSTAPNTGLYDELRFYDNPAFNSLDIAPFTANSSVYKNRPPKPQHVQNTRGRRFEPVSFAGQTDVKASRSSSRRMRWLVALNVLLLFLTIICLALTSFLYYKVIPKGDDGDGGNGCDSGSRRAEGKSIAVTSHNDHGNAYLKIITIKYFIEIEGSIQSF